MLTRKPESTSEAPSDPCRSPFFVRNFRTFSSHLRLGRKAGDEGGEKLAAMSFLFPLPLKQHVYLAFFAESSRRCAA